MTGLNDTVLRNIIGDGSGDRGDFLSRELPKWKAKRLPKKDMYGRNLEEPEAPKENLGEKFAKRGTEVKQVFGAIRRGFQSTGTVPKAPAPTYTPTKYVPTMGEAISMSPITSTTAGPKVPRSLKEPGAAEFASRITGVPVKTKPIDLEITQRPSEMQQLNLAYRQAQVLEKQQIAEQKRAQVEKTRLDLQQKQAELAAQTQKLAFERGATRTERFFKSAQRIASPLVENLGAVAGGAFAGSFTNPLANTKYNNAIMAYNAYFAYMKNKYAKKGIAITSDNDIMAVGTAGERKRIIDLRDDIKAKGANVAATGFLSGGGQKAALIRLGQQANLQSFTQLGRAGGGMGTFGPESYGRLGISQGLRSTAPQNKWESLLGKTSGGADKIGAILGKGPDPYGARERLKRYL